MKNRVIIGLLIFGTVLFGIMMFVIIPGINSKEKTYLLQQNEPTTADVNFITKYKSKYMGDASNISHLYHKLPLATTTMTFEEFPDTLTFQINFNDTVLNVGKESNSYKQRSSSGNVDKINGIYENEVEKSLIYNSTAAFALIDNLQYINYNFSDATYKVSRTDIESLYNDFHNIINKSNWDDKVQNKLKDRIYVDNIAKKILIRQ